MALRYLPEGRTLPPSVVVGHADLAATMRGSQLAPTIDVDFKLPTPRATGCLQLTREATRLTLSSPWADASGVLHLQPPPLEAVKAAVTQAQASRRHQCCPPPCACLCRCYPY